MCVCVCVFLKHLRVPFHSTYFRVSFLRKGQEPWSTALIGSTVYLQISSHVQLLPLPFQDPIPVTPSIYVLGPFNLPQSGTVSDSLCFLTVWNSTVGDFVEQRTVCACLMFLHHYIQVIYTLLAEISPKHRLLFG